MSSTPERDETDANGPLKGAASVGWIVGIATYLATIIVVCCLGLYYFWPKCDCVEMKGASTPSSEAPSAKVADEPAKPGQPPAAGETTSTPKITAIAPDSGPVGGGEMVS